MSKWGIVDIGSNTVVLVIYDSISPIHVQEYYSEAVHLIGYNNNGVMLQEGIDKTLNVLRQYKKRIEEAQVEEYYAFITEPWRHLKNTDDFLNQLAQSGFIIDPLSGRQEAELTFFGSRMDCSHITKGNAFDVGGGSSELISYIDNEIHEAYSIPVGAVRLRELPLSPAIPAKYLLEAFSVAPKLLDTPSEIMVGIGGTARATALMAHELYPGEIMTRELVGTILENLIQEETRTITAMKKVITPGRWPVLKPGMNMVCGIMDAYHAKTLIVSEGCVREGYLLSQQKNH